MLSGTSAPLAEQIGLDLNLDLRRLAKELRVSMGITPEQFAGSGKSTEELSAHRAGHISKTRGMPPTVKHGWGRSQ